ncbi:MAG: 4-hydroxy-3-methylbut-2-enyl diphosphate reductase [Crocinitomicaceae bacterium]|nr:4-hydroxy-3-methylbut-2-enyl diphosphate reductase [Crocinitomicaceae bacterium]|tara:strand:- start:13591 stop:14802 length:1212 start_codon:yes stop_codon:yes gene_type:complete
MKKFNIPEYYKSEIISRVKAKRKLEDPRKKDFSPTILKFGDVEFIISRHFGFCYGVENAIERSYLAIEENPNKRIFLISQMIHNPDVNQDLLDQGVKFIQDTDGTQLIPWKDITPEDIVIIPAFGTTKRIHNLLLEKGVDVKTYNTTCPFVEKVWNRSKKLGKNKHTIIIHGKYNHEETKATFSHSRENSPSLIVKNMEETKFLTEYILGKHSTEKFKKYFENKYSDNFNPEKNLNTIGVVNQTTMLASETQEISDIIRSTMIKKFGEENIKNHFADTRDTLCYATNDNQSATLELLNLKADLAIVVGGYNSSNTSHLVELLEEKFKTFFIKNEKEILDKNLINSFDIHSKKNITSNNFLGDNDKLKIIITSGASCPDAIVDNVIKKILHLMKVDYDINKFNL